MKTVNIHEAKTHFSQIIQDVIEGGSYIIAKSGKPVGKLIPYSGSGKPRVPGGSWAGKVKMDKDFDSLPLHIQKMFYED